MTRRVGMRPAAVLVVPLVLLATALLAAPPSRASAGGAPTRSAGGAASAPGAVDRPAVGAGALGVRIVELSPAIPGPGDALTVQGTVTNTSDQPVTASGVGLRLSPTPLVNRDEIPEVLAGAGQRTGRLVPGAQQPLADPLPAGASVGFSLSVPVDDLGLRTAGVYVIGVEATGDAGAGPARQDLDRTFLPWWPPDSGIEPLLVTTIWPLSTAPLQDAEGNLLTEEPALDMSPGGRLAALLDAAAADPGAVTLTVDPGTVAMAADLADGYEVREVGGDLQPGTRSTQVADWLAALVAAVGAPGAQVAGSLVAWPDVDAARRGRVLGRVLRQQPAVQDRAREILGVGLGRPLALLPGGVAEPGTLAVLAGTPARAAVLSDRAMPLMDPAYFTASGNVVLPTRRGDLSGLLVDSGLAATLALPMDAPAEQTAVRQALLAQTLVTAGELPDTPRLVVAAPEPMWSPSAGAAQMVAQALTAAPWVIPTPVDAALAREPGTLPRAAVDPNAEEVDQQLPPGHVARVRQQYLDLAAYSSVVTDEYLIDIDTRTAPSRLLGAWFRTHPATRNELTGIVSDQIGGLVGSVRVVSSGSITVSGTSGTIPITVDNDGPQAVTIGLVLTSTPPQFFSADPVEPFTIDPARRTSVVVSAEVAASGPIPITIQMVTADGQPFGEPGRLVVESAAYANAARVLVRVALAALVLAVAVHGVRRARRRRASRRTRGEPEDDDRSGAGVEVAAHPGAGRTDRG